MDQSHHLEPSPNHSDDTGSQIEHHEHHSSMGHAGHDHLAQQAPRSSAMGCGL